MVLSVKLGPLELNNPIMNASGTFGMGLEMERFFDLKIPGALVLKTITYNPRIGNAPPRLAESASGLLNSIGLPNAGVHAFVKEQLPQLVDRSSCLIVNFAGEREEEFPQAAAVLDGREGIDALEINLSCPNVADGALPFSKEPQVVERIVRSVRAVTDLPLLAKLSPNVGDIVEVADAAMQGGADILTLINTLLGMSLCWRTRKPRLSTVFGGLSGPAIKPVALRMVHQVHRALKAPIVGVGGITDENDVMEFLVAGAAAVQIGTATFSDPATIPDLVNKLHGILAETGCDSLGDFVGTLNYGS
ncbi:MAG: dihydroorotate dehydrogenase [Planctomycetes bacterium]|nr:dihydroorotate dehydrogenase [Planctomycetota bacterium]